MDRQNLAKNVVGQNDSRNLCIIGHLVKKVVIWPLLEN